MAGNLEGKVALISGVARGQGRAHAIRLAKEGCGIIGFDHLEDYDSVIYKMSRKDDLDETVKLVEKAGGRMIAHKADARDRSAIEAVVADGIKAFGRLDIVSANAGICPPGRPFWEVPGSDWDDIIGVNLTGVFHTCAAAVKPMLERGEGGSIIVTSSGAGLKATSNLADYNSSKFGVIGLAKTMANELAAHRIRVNVICPTTVRTDMVLNDGLYRLFRPDLESPTVDDVIPVLQQMNPIPEPWVDPSDISNAVAWLASDESRYVTGIVLPVDLGVSNKA